MNIALVLPIRLWTNIYQRFLPARLAYALLQTRVSYRLNAHFGVAFGRCGKSGLVCSVQDVGVSPYQNDIFFSA